MNVDVILGLQWGDEGKGKVVDVLTPNYDIVARFQGGPNVLMPSVNHSGFDCGPHLLHLVAGLLFDVAAVEHAGHGGYGYARLAGNVVYRQAEPPVDM